MITNNYVVVLPIANINYFLFCADCKYQSKLETVRGEIKRKELNYLTLKASPFNFPKMMDFKVLIELKWSILNILFLLLVAWFTFLRTGFFLVRVYHLGPQSFLNIIIKGGHDSWGLPSKWVTSTQNIESHESHLMRWVSLTFSKLLNQSLKGHKLPGLVRYYMTTLIAQVP